MECRDSVVPRRHAERRCAARAKGVLLRIISRYSSRQSPSSGHGSRSLAAVGRLLLAVLIALPPLLALMPSTASANVAAPASLDNGAVDTVTVNNHSLATLLLLSYSSNANQVLPSHTSVPPLGTSGWTT